MAGLKMAGLKMAGFEPQIENRRIEDRWIQKRQVCQGCLKKCGVGFKKLCSAGNLRCARLGYPYCCITGQRRIEDSPDRKGPGFWQQPRNLPQSEYCCLQEMERSGPG